MHGNEKHKYYAAFSYLDVKPLLKSKLFEYFDFDIKRAFLSTENELAKFSKACDISVPPSFYAKKSKLDVDLCYKQALDLEGIKILTYEDEKYPELLKEIPDFPLSLYYLGSLDNIDFSCTVAIVGSRMASQGAKNALASIVAGLKNSNVLIVSGLAYGIDAAAHQAALDNNLKTIGVIGSGLDIVYPYANKGLYQDILEAQGAIFSEYHLGVKPVSYNFPRRNRIVVGISKGTLVAEAQVKSGAMISANLTLDYNRELMCIPGNILNPNTSGIYQLIKNGASIITETQDLLNALDWDIAPQAPSEITLNPIQQKILDALAFEEKHFDEIMYYTKEDIASVMVALTELELKGLIKQANSIYYILK